MPGATIIGPLVKRLRSFCLTVVMYFSSNAQLLLDHFHLLHVRGELRAERIGTLEAVELRHLLEIVFPFRRLLRFLHRGDEAIEDGFRRACLRHHPAPLVAYEVPATLLVSRYRRKVFEALVG